jgi:hypothetical protein
VANKAAAGRSLVSSNSSRTRSQAKAANKVVSKAAKSKTNSDVIELFGPHFWGPFSFAHICGGCK